MGIYWVALTVFWTACSSALCAAADPLPVTMLTPAAKASMRLSQTGWHDFLWMKMLPLVIVFSS